jgi:hypothetical protein
MAATLLLFAPRGAYFSAIDSVGRRCCHNMAIWVRLTEKRISEFVYSRISMRE